MIAQTPLVAWILSEIDYAGSVNETALREKLAEMRTDTGEHRACDVLETVRRWDDAFPARPVRDHRRLPQAHQGQDPVARSLRPLPDPLSRQRQQDIQYLPT